MTEAAERTSVVPNKPSLQVVAIGASAGGIPALQELLSALPAKLGAAVAVVLHLDPTHESELAAILATRTDMSVVQVNERLLLEADTVYVIAPNSSLVLSGDEILCAPLTEAQHGQRTPIDTLFKSLAQMDGDGFAVVLTGNGSDGALGASAVKAAGGIVLVQDPAEAEYPSMPQSAIASGPDYVLPLRQLAGRLAVLIQTKAETSMACSL